MRESYLHLVIKRMKSPTTVRSTHISWVILNNRNRSRDAYTTNRLIVQRMQLNVNRGQRGLLRLLEPC